MLYDLDITKQRKQFTNVIDHLLETGHKQKDIAKKIGLNSYDISHLISGSIKNIPYEVIENLHDEFEINPNYIIKGATNMYDIPGIKYENFENFVDDWDLVEHENEEYLHFKMDENFYNFLIEIYKLKEAFFDSETSKKTTESTVSNTLKQMPEAFKKASSSLMENYKDSNKSKEYVLIPADDAIKIATENVPKRKHLREVIDILKVHSPKIKFKKK